MSFKDHKIPRKLNFLSLARFLTYTLALDDNESSRPKGNVVKGLSNSVLKGKNDHEHASVLARSNSKNNGSLTIKVGHFSGDKGCFPFNKNSGLKFRKFHVPTGTVSYRASGYCSCKQGTTILSNGKGPFGKTDRKDQTGQRGPPSKLVPNIPVGPNRNSLFHIMYQPKFPEFGTPKNDQNSDKFVENLTR